MGKQQQRETLISHGLSANLIENVLKVSEANWQVIMNHLPRMYSGRVVYLSALENREQGFGYYFDPMQPNGWNDWVAGGIEVIEVPGMHGTFHNEPHVRVLAEKLNACLEQAGSG